MAVLTRMRRAAAFAIPTIVFLAGFSVPAHGSLEAAEEYEIKAAMYVNLVRLVDWPPGRFGDASAPLVIGVSGSDDMARALEAAAAPGMGRSASGGRRIVVRKISAPSDAAECQSVFFGGGDKKKIESTLGSLARSPVLTVGESDRFTSLGGMVGLVVRGDRVQIEVNLDAAQGAGLAVSSRLLKIAVVRTGGSP